MFFDYAAYTSGIFWMICFGRKQIYDSWVRIRERMSNKEAKISEQYGDQLSILQRSYQEVPAWWFGLLFGASFVSLITIIALGKLYIPIWTYFVAIGTGAILVVPLGWLYALSNFQLPIGTVNELLYGLMANSVTGHKNPVGASVYGAIAGNAWYRAQYNLQDMKIGHYMHVPPRDVFFSQIFGSFLGIPVNYAVIRWVLDTKADYLTGKVVDPSHQWTGQELVSNLTMAVQYVMIVSIDRSSNLTAESSLTPSPGTPTSISATHLPLPSPRLPTRRHRPDFNLHPPPPLPSRQIPALEHDHLLQRHVALLRKHQLRVLEQSHRRLRSYVLGVSLPLHSMGTMELYSCRCLRRRLQLQHAADLLVFRSWQDCTYAALVGQQRG